MTKEGFLPKVFSVLSGKMLKSKERKLRQEIQDLQRDFIVIQHHLELKKVENKLKELKEKYDVVTAINKKLKMEISKLNEFLNENECKNPENENVDMHNQQIMKRFDVNDLQLYISQIRNNVDKTEQLKGTVCVRKYLSNPKQNANHKIEDIMQKIMDSGIVKRIIENMENYDDSELQYESSWIICNLCASNNKAICIKLYSMNVIEKFINILYKNESSDDMIDQCLCGLSNISGDDDLKYKVYQNIDLFHYILNNTLRYQMESENFKICDNALRLILNLTRNNSKISWRSMKYVFNILLPILLKLEEKLSVNDDQQETKNSIKQCCMNILWIFEHLHFYVQNPGFTQDIIECNIIETLIRFMNYDDLCLKLPSIKTVGHLLAMNDTDKDNTMTKYILDKGYLDACDKNIDCNHERICAQTAWTLSNIACIDALCMNLIEYKSGSLIKKVCQNCCNTYCSMAQREFAWIIGNLLSHNNKIITNAVVNRGGIKALYRVLSNISGKDNVSAINMILESLQCIFIINNDDYVQKMRTNKIFQILSKIANDENLDEDITVFAKRLLVQNSSS